ncbi:hypothetical protein FHU28_002343 [Micromonospora echinospora]|uniref:LysR family transcriptional regulator n=1 Tax=Micromonospora echinospora TaxID=1877 RepID=A0ABR6MBN9_MICEC|nr:hypothetical protein [Micromonospora echinospora]
MRDRSRVSLTQDAEGFVSLAEVIGRAAVLTLGGAA